MKKILLIITFLVTSIPHSFAQEELSYYLPTHVPYDLSVPTPKSIIGHQVGEWHISHDKLVQYMYALAKSSDRVAIEEYARSYENRPLLVLTISSSSNMEQITSIQKQHIQISNPQLSSSIALTKAPVVTYLGYSVHGNEASGSNAALLMAYYLAAAEGPEIDSLLQNSVILLDPSLNPDGLNRFANWVNTRKSQNLVSDPNNDEHDESWPGGRTNHYWFDLNRDWMPLQHPESRGRVALFHQWKPNILTDHHEMGTNSTYFFQPGVSSRNNPLIPKSTTQLNEKIATFHASNLDAMGSFYYSKESFDDFYIGKGSTYPDVNGCVGILFEQASARGHAQASENGVLTFPFAIRNHVATSLSTLEASQALRTDLLKNQRQFYLSALDNAKNDPIKAYIFKEPNDKTRLDEFIKVIEQHQINIFELAKTVGQFQQNESFIIPLNQPQYRMIKSLFEKQTEFTDSLFYDVSAWTLPLAFGINHASLTSKNYTSDHLGNKVTSRIKESKPVGTTTSKYAYLFDWSDYNSPGLLYAIQKLGVRTKVSTTKLTLENETTFSRGAIIVPVQNQNLNTQSLFENLTRLAAQFKIQIHGLEGGSTKGIYLGSPKIESISIPKPLLVVGRGVSSYEAGEIWHLLDQRMGVAIPKVTINRLNSIDLSKYNTIIMVSGSYGKVNQAKLKTWLQNGGRVIAIKSAAKWLSDASMSKMKFKKTVKDSTFSQRPYATINQYNGAQRIGGAIFSTKLDLTHPLCFGYRDNQLWTLKNSTLMMEKSKNPYANPVTYTYSPLASGYISKRNLDKLNGTAVIGLSSLGSGKIISFADNPNFRAFWFGTNKLFLNALFFSEIINFQSMK